jgi:hypothetical protein
MLQHFRSFADNKKRNRPRQTDRYICKPDPLYVWNGPVWNSGNKYIVYTLKTHATPLQMKVLPLRKTCLCLQVLTVFLAQPGTVLSLPTLKTRSILTCSLHIHKAVILDEFITNVTPRGQPSGILQRVVIVEADWRISGPAMMMEAVSSLRKSVVFYEVTRCSILQGCHLHIGGRKNLKTHQHYFIGSKIIYRLNLNGIWRLLAMLRVYEFETKQRQPIWSC